MKMSFIEEQKASKWLFSADLAGKALWKLKTIVLEAFEVARYSTRNNRIKTKRKMSSEVIRPSADDCGTVT